MPDLLRFCGKYGEMVIESVAVCQACKTDIKDCKS
jgi:hypothetical protein